MKTRTYKETSHNGYSNNMGSKDTLRKGLPLPCVVQIKSLVVETKSKNG